MRRDGICKNYGDSGKQLKAQDKDESQSTSTSVIEKGDGSSGSAAKRTQWTREQKLEFINLYKIFNKARAARAFKARYKVKLKSNTYNLWLAQEKNIWEASFRPRKIGSGGKAAYPEMEKRLYEEFKIFREEGVKVKE